MYTNVIKLLMHCVHVRWKKNTLLDHFSMNLIPYSRYACTVLSREKKTLLLQFLDEPDTPLTFEWPPDVRPTSKVSMPRLPLWPMRGQPEEENGYFCIMKVLTCYYSLWFVFLIFTSFPLFEESFKTTQLYYPK